MAIKDHSKYYEGLRQSPTPPEDLVPNTVSRHIKVGDRAFTSVVTQAGRPILDAELNSIPDILRAEQHLFRRWQTPSGWLRGRSHSSSCAFVFETSPVGLVDDSGSSLVQSGTLVNSFVLPRLEALVAGMPVVVEYTNTRTSGYNLVQLETPTIYDGTAGTVKRTDFAFLEVWKAVVPPSPRATGTITVVDSSTLANGDQILINGVTLTAAAVPVVDQFSIDAASGANTAANIATALNDVANSFAVMVSAVSIDTVVHIYAGTPGAGSALALPPTGNFITIAVNFAGGGTIGSWIASAATLTGGADRPNKPVDDQGTLYRHGNVLSPSATWLEDELLDPTLRAETSQRVQIQYRIRVTGAAEAVNYKTHPDGFSSKSGGAGTIFAQAGRDGPVYAGNPAGDPVSYPFVPADGTSTWLQSDAVAYGYTDQGLWIAGDGSETAAQYLSAVDGFVYAIPLGFIFRHNDASTGAFKGFDPVNNANGGPLFGHGGYAGALGAIPAGRSDRPDGKFADVVSADRLLDLRRHIIPSGVDTKAELQYQMQCLLDGTHRTWAVDIADKQNLGGNTGDVSTQYLVCNEIGRSAATGGVAPFTGSTGRGEVIRNFDHIARRFGSQPVVERVLVAFWPGDRDPANPQGGAVAPGLLNAGKYVTKDESAPGVPYDADAWAERDTLVLDLTALNASTLGGIFSGGDGGGDSSGLANPDFTDFAPAGTVITDVLGMWHDDGHYTAAVDQTVQASLITGLGTSKVEIRVDANDIEVNGGNPVVAIYQMVGYSGSTHDGSPRRIFVDFEITYPLGAGLTDTPDLEVVPDSTVYDGNNEPGPGAMIETSTSQRPNDHEICLAPRFREGFREVQLEYVGNNVLSHAVGAPGSGAAVTDSIVSATPTTLYFPRRVFGTTGGPLAGLTQVTDSVVAAVKTIDPAATEFGSSSRQVTLSTAFPATSLSGGGQTLCDIEYFAQDPIPNYGAAPNGYQIGVYFRSNAPQTAGTKDGNILTTGAGTLPVELRVEPLLMSDNVWTGQVGMGGHDLPFPYVAPLDQIPIHDGFAGTTEEWFFAATAEVGIDDFNANTGLLALHPFVQADVQNVYTFGGAGASEFPRKDAEFRAYYPFADDGTYRPTILTQPLYGATSHKVMVPFLGRVVEDTPGVDGGLLFRAGEMILVVLTRFAELDDGNDIRFLEVDNRTCAAVYRTQNLLLVIGDEVCQGT